MFIIGIGTAAPPKCYSQQQCWEALQNSKRFWELDARARALLKKVLNGDNGTATRHLALHSLEEAFDLRPDALQSRFAEYAPDLAFQAATRALANAATLPSELDAVLISTCTGYLCPGLTSYVSERLGTRPDALMLDLVGQGCGAAVPNLRMAEALLRAGPSRRVLSVCVEVCSAALFFDNDPGVLVSACLFGDGAGAAVLSSQPQGACRLEWKGAGSLLNPKDRDLLRFEHQAGMLRNILRPQVPALASESAERVLGQVLEGAGIEQERICGWLFHPGGRDVLLALRERLKLSEEDLRWSAAVLRKFGNLSSASVYFVLETALADSARDGYWWMSSFGAGFSCHGALLEVRRGG